MIVLKLVGEIASVVLAAWLQVTWFGHVRPLGVMPNVMLVLIVLFGLWSNASPSVAAAIGGGLLLDLVSGSDFGLRTAFFAVVALAIIAGRQYGLHADSILTGLAIVALGTLLYNVVVLATIGAPVAGIVFRRIGAELIDNEVLLLLLMLVRVNLGGGRIRATFDLGARLPK